MNTCGTNFVVQNNNNNSTIFIYTALARFVFCFTVKYLSFVYNLTLNILKTNNTCKLLSIISVIKILFILLKCVFC